jgi:hypothetical protein
MRVRVCWPLLIVHRDVAGEHLTDGRPCWCEPKVIRLAPRPRAVPRRGRHAR